MKFRQGFVSNSSSSSFIITDFSEEKVRKYIEKLLESSAVLHDVNETIDDKLTIYTIEDSDLHRVSHYNWYEGFDESEEITLEQYKIMNGRKDIVEKAVVVESTSDNSIPWFIQEALENIGERFHWG